MRSKLLRSLAVILASLLALAFGYGMSFFHDRPDLRRYPIQRRPALPPGSSLEGITLNHLGVSTVLVSDGETSLMTDGFFSRPPLWKLLLGRPVEPDTEKIGIALASLGVESLAAVLVVHSHYDHAMDAPEVAQRTGALLVGSRSTANVGRGWGLPEEQIRVVVPGEPLTFGRFRVTFLKSRHLPLPGDGGSGDTSTREIAEPLVPPVAPSAYREGGSYSIWIEHPWGRLLVQASAGYLEGGLADVEAEVVLLGIGGLGRQDPGYREAYYREVVEAVGARRIFPIHWDDFTLPFEDPMRPLARIDDDVGASLDFLVERTSRERMSRVEFLPERRPMLLFERQAPRESARSGPKSPSGR